MAANDLSSKLAKQLKDKGPDARPVMVTAEAAFPQRLSLDLTKDDHTTLKVAAAQNGTTAAAILRALISEWREDADLAARIIDRL